MDNNYFELLNSINVNDKTEKKNNLTYLSWAWAWAEIKKRFPDAAYTVYENERGWNYHTDGRTAWVKTGMTVNGIEHIEYLPVMDYRNASIPLEKVTSYDVNKAIQRSLTKAAARHGLGLYIYAGEDLPEDEPIEEKTKQQSKQQPKQPKPSSASAASAPGAAEHDEMRINLEQRKALFDAWEAKHGKIAPDSDAFPTFLKTFGYSDTKSIMVQDYQKILERV